MTRKKENFLRKSPMKSYGLARIRTKKESKYLVLPLHSELTTFIKNFFDKISIKIPTNV